MMTDLRASLDDLAEAAFADDPVCTVDIGKARADGRRRVRASRLASVGGGVAVVAVCALVANGLGGTSPAHPPAPSSNTTTAPDLIGTDPLIPIGTFGYLPDGYRINSYQLDTDPNLGGIYNYVGPNSISASPAQPAQNGPIGQFPGPSNGLFLSKWTREPNFSSPYKTLTPTTVSGSSKAYIVADTTDSPADLSLAWQTASGSWFALGGDYAIHGAQLTALLTRVADSITTEGAAVPLPFHVEGLPKDLTLISAGLNDPDPIGHVGMRAGIAYAADGPPNKSGYFSISITPSAGLSPVPATQTGTYVVQPSDSQSSPSGSTNTPQPAEGDGVCKDSKGLRICVLDHVVAGVDALASVGGPEALLDRITSLGMDKANWTTHVVN
ncbi:hypothetical protein ABH926_005407 [Catenulispora sp. GP43]|uniref:hypothetical protein n=1 Tax=Catenulispora sp. GP43 TaxID=3156263 RepID=UPI0035152DEC